MTQQTAQLWQGSSGRTGQLCSSQEFVPPEEAKSFSTLSQISSCCEKTTSGEIEKNRTNIKQTFNIRMCPGFISINIQLKYTSDH